VNDPLPQAALRVVAAVVTRDRRDLLAGCLTALRRQTRPPDAIYVFDNASTDGSREFLESERGLTVLRSAVNVGGAGGFHALLERSVADGFDWVWLLDDDSEPRPDALARLLIALTDYPPGSLSVLASKVVWTDGRVHPMNLVGPRFGSDRDFFYASVEHGHLSIRTASFVSCAIHRDAVLRHGLPCQEYFLWNDDTEYTARLLRHGRGICVPASVTVHRTGIPYGTLDAPAGRFRYHLRNQIWMLKRSPAFSRREKLKVLLIYLATAATWCARHPFTRLPFAAAVMIRALFT
jgi:GT2 family glycosyltransferase